MTLPAGLAPLGERRQFILCEFRPNAKGGTDKVPLRWDTATEHSAHDPAVWLTYEQARAIAGSWSLDAGRRFGVGFVFTDADPFFFLDVDHCVGADGQWDDRARWAFASFPEAAIEISQSGSGLHVFGSYSGAAPPHRKKRADLGMELYTAERFVALTGIVPQGWAGSAAADCTGKLQWLASALFEPTPAGEAPAWQEGPDPRWKGPAEDQAIIAYGRTHEPPLDAATAFGGAVRGTFEDLWTGNLVPWNGDASSADYALAFELAKLTGFDCPRIERIMRQSALARDKWDARSDYLRERTIVAGVAAARAGFERQWAAGKPYPKEWWPLPQPQVVQQQQAAIVAPADGQWQPPSRRYAYGELGTDQTRDYFRGYRWIASEDVIVDPRGVRWDMKAFNSEHAGRRFALPNTSGTWKAWDAAIQHVPHFDKSDYDFARPFLDEARDAHGATTLNLAKLPPIKMSRGPTRAFFRHLKRLWPDRDKRRVFAYWAQHAIQKRGEVLAWAPVVQGVQGNGKSTLVNIIAKIVGSSWEFDIHKVAKSGTIGFNGFMAEHVLMIANEPKLGESRDVLNTIKTYVVDEYFNVEWKGRDQKTVKNHLTWIVTTNYQNGIPIEHGDRRWAPLFCAQQKYEDIDQAAVSAWFRWSRDPANIAAVAEWFMRKDAVTVVRKDCTLLRAGRASAHRGGDPRWDGTRAPVTADTVVAIESARGVVEQTILEYIDEEHDGFKAGWLSMYALREKLPRVSPQTLRRAVDALGYVPHPSLDTSEGKVRLSSGVRTRLYVKAGSAATLLRGHDAVRDAFVAAQLRGVAALVPVPAGPPSDQPVGPPPFTS